MSEKMRIVQELVPGKQISIAHVIANPDESLFKALSVSQNFGAIGVVTMTPAETAVIAADITVKAAGIKIMSLDYHENGTLLISGTVSEVMSALTALCEYAKNKLGFEVCEITKT